MPPVGVEMHRRQWEGFQGFKQGRDTGTKKGNIIKFALQKINLAKVWNMGWWEGDQLVQD